MTSEMNPLNIKEKFNAVTSLYADRAMTPQEKIVIARYSAALDLLQNQPPLEMLGLIFECISKAQFALTKYEYFKAEGLHTILSLKRYN